MARDQSPSFKPDSADAHNKLGLALKKQDKLEEAVASFRQALQLKPNYAEVHHNLGCTFASLGRLEDAVLCYQRAIGLQPNNAEAYTNLGCAFSRLGKLDEATLSFRKVLRFKRELDGVPQNLACTLAGQPSLHPPSDRPKFPRHGYYQQIPGWFDFEDLYDRIVSESSPNGLFVEIGAWFGRSTAYLAQCIKDSGKKTKLYVVDTWKGSPAEPFHQQMVQRYAGSIYRQFLENMSKAKVDDVITPMEMRSDEAVLAFEDESLDFVFLDASHRYEHILRDLALWYPKVKPGGVFAGHDYQPAWPGVVRAVNEFFGRDAITRIGYSFWFRRYH